jgi:ABC-type multidrug transport system fused ATPase/permease subunit
MLAASYAANAHEFIHSLPDGYDTQLGEKGIRLSGGQRQRIAIARAFLKDAPLLIMDEATSHLDTESEGFIAAALAALMQGRTTLIIAHRLALVYKSDQIVVIDNGRVAQSGSHNDLLSQEGPYRYLYASYTGETAPGGFQP